MAHRHHVETIRVKGLNPGGGTVALKDSGLPLQQHLDQRSAEGWEVVSVAPIGHLEVIITLRRTD
ncbi:MAG: hypothetical protein HYV09_12430 [Deltaproteobacteria bacterium]|nr:hypothetical protein [Deltaproteobacteria bacterium]